MTGQEIITYCFECEHCFKSNRSRTGYSCAVWGYDDFASDTILSGFCHKAKPKCNSMGVTFKLSDLEQMVKGENT